MRASSAAIPATVAIGILSLITWAGVPNDSDMDGTPDVLDICVDHPSAPNPVACDTDLDGYGNQCDADFNDDGVVGGPDFAVFGSSFGTIGAPCSIEADMNGDGTVGGPDFGIFAFYYGAPPGPSGLSCAGTAPCP